MKEMATFYSGLPDGVRVLETGHDVVGDGEGEAEAVGGAVLEREGVALVIRHERNRQNQVRPPWCQDGEVEYGHLRFDGLWT